MIKLIFVFISLVLMGCATGYQKDGLGGGFKDTKISEDLYRISFQGNAYTDRQQAADYALLRAAEVTTENGFNYFAILDEREGSQTIHYVSPSSTDVKGTFRGNQFSGTTTQTGGQSYLFNLPNQRFIIRTFKTKPGIEGIVYDANEVITNLRQQYGIKKGDS